MNPQSNPNDSKPREAIMENEIRVKKNGNLTNYIHYGYNLLEKKSMSSLIIKATGNSIPKAISLAESFKRKYRGLHQNISIGTTVIVSTKNSDDNQDEAPQERKVNYIEIVLSKDILDTSSPGYQAPIDDELFQQFSELSLNKPKRRFNRSSNNNRNVRAQSMNNNFEPTTTENNQPSANQTEPNNTARNFRNSENNTNSAFRNKRKNNNRVRRGPKPNTPPSATGNTTS